MPVYNEAGAIEPVVREWHEALAATGVRFRLAVYDDGSRDGTSEVLTRLAGQLPELDVVRHANRGHGPTILRGYAEATSEWVFQTDSDGEIPAGAFADLWSARDSCDLVLGRRIGREQTGTRRAISRLASALIRTGFGPGVTDVNTPCRLMRREMLAELLPWVPPTLFAPNVVLSGLAVRFGYRVRELPVRFEARRSGAGTLLSWRIWRAALRSGFETVQVIRRARRSGR